MLIQIIYLIHHFMILNLHQIILKMIKYKINEIKIKSILSIFKKTLNNEDYNRN